MDENKLALFCQGRFFPGRNLVDIACLLRTIMGRGAGERTGRKRQAGEGKGETGYNT
jgi:hypothetical protein